MTKADMNKGADLISDEVLIILLTVNLAVLAGLIALFGIVSNILNMVIFIKQGLNDTVNIGLLAMAVSDLCSLVTLEWINILNNPLFIDNVPLVAVDVQHLTAAWPHASFARITSWITAYITFERCLCVVLPLKVKSIITPRVTICVIVCIYAATILTLIPEYASCYIDWRHVPQLNRSLLGLVFRPGRDQMATLSFNLGVGSQVASFGAVILFTSLLVIKMSQKSRWRKSTSNSAHETSIRDKRSVQMIILVAIIYSVCFFPMLCIYVATSMEPELIIFGAYNNSFFTVWSFAFLLDSINSSVNIFVYYKMSTKYRTMFGSLFGKTIAK